MSGDDSLAGGIGADAQDYVTVRIDGQLFGLPILQVQDVFTPDAITMVPLAPNEIAGVLNLRGRIVTAIDMRLRLGLQVRADGSEGDWVEARDIDDDAAARWTDPKAAE